MRSENLGMAIEAKTPIIATTIISSIRVNPLRFIKPPPSLYPLPQRERENPLQSANVPLKKKGGTAVNSPPLPLRQKKRLPYQVLQI
jgi:hypothetical protein